jgi:hypothetical protein
VQVEIQLHAVALFQVVRLHEIACGKERKKETRSIDRSFIRSLPKSIIKNISVENSHISKEGELLLDTLLCSSARLIDLRDTCILEHVHPALVVGPEPATQTIQKETLRIIIDHLRAAYEIIRSNHPCLLINNRSIDRDRSINESTYQSSSQIPVVHVPHSGGRLEILDPEVHSIPRFEMRQMSLRRFLQHTY